MESQAIILGSLLRLLPYRKCLKESSEGSKETYNFHSSAVAVDFFFHYYCDAIESLAQCGLRKYWLHKMFTFQPL